MFVSFPLLAGDNETTLTVFHTGDMHGRGMSDDGIGYGKISAFVKSYRAKSKNVLFLDAGDAVSGIPVADLRSGETNIDVMNTMGYDAFTPGNADFIFGGENIRSLEKKATFPFVTSNVLYKGELAFKPYIIKIRCRNACWHCWRFSIKCNGGNNRRKTGWV